MGDERPSGDGLIGGGVGRWWKIEHRRLHRGQRDRRPLQPAQPMAIFFSRPAVGGVVVVGTAVGVLLMLLMLMLVVAGLIAMLEDLVAVAIGVLDHHHMQDGRAERLHEQDAQADGDDFDEPFEICVTVSHERKARRKHFHDDL